MNKGGKVACLFERKLHLINYKQNGISTKPECWEQVCQAIK